MRSLPEEICAACAVEDGDADAARFEDEVGMAWIRGYVEGVATAAGKAALGGFCEPHAAYFNALVEKLKTSGL